MFQIYHSNALDLLKDLMVRLIDNEPLADPFANETILVQSPGMAQWLKLELAQGLKIAASVEFPLPASFLWQQFSQVLPDVPERSAYNKEAMSWKLMMLLPELLDQEPFLPLAGYLQDDESGVKRYQLANRIADVFDQYLMYRPDWLEDWQAGGVMDAEEHPWQPILWRSLVHRTEQELQQPHWHRANMLQAFVEALRSQGRDTGLPSRIFIFGISALPEKMLEALQILGKHTDVHLMIANPCRYYWGDIVDEKTRAKIQRRWFDKPGINPVNYFEQGNPLLASMGKLGRDYLYLLQTMSVSEIELFEEPVEQGLLGRIQNDILNLDDRSRTSGLSHDSSYKTVLAEDDKTLQLHSCHSALREIEVLHDQLLAMFDQQPELTPRDVVVMMPDVAGYAPYIEAVFGNAPFERRIPYAISDRTVQQESPLLQNFLKLLSLADSRLPVSEVLELMELPAVLRKFKLNQQQFDQIRHWVDAVRIRWGLDADDRLAQALPAFSQNSWQFGMDRMLAGYALGEQEIPWLDIAPFADVEGLDAALLGALAEFMMLLSECRTTFTGSDTLANWVQHIHRLLEQIYHADDEDELALAEIRQVLQQLQQQHQDACFEAELDAIIIRDYLNDALAAERSSQRFMVGSVNFCTLMPMRSIPFKVVCLLGMNDGAFPRTMPPLGFDLMKNQLRRGDRSRRDDDRYLFLEALLAARQQFYISFIGRSVVDNREKVASVLVNELLDYCCDSFVLPADVELIPEISAENLREHLIQQHPLTAFSPEYFRTGSELFSYAAEWLPVAGVQKQAETTFMRQPLPLERPDQLELTALLRFFANPCSYFFRERLNVVFDHLEPDAEDEEPFNVDGLDDYLIKQRYLHAAMSGDDLQPIDQSLVAEGVLPLGIAGKQRLQRLRQDSSDLAAKLAHWCADPEKRVEIRQTLQTSQGEIELTGWLDGIYGSRLVRCRPSQVQGKDRLATWIQHLAYCAQYPVADASLYRGLSNEAWLQPLSQLDARNYLTELLEVWLQGLCQPLAFDPQAAWAYMELKEKDEDKARAKAQSRFEGGFRQHGVCEDAYISRVYPSFNHYWPGLQRLAEQVFNPLMPLLEEKKDD